MSHEGWEALLTILGIALTAGCGASPSASSPSTSSPPPASALAHPHPEIGARNFSLHSDMEMAFTIHDNVLSGFRCGGAEILAVAPPRLVTNGEFFLIGDGVEIAGRIVAVDQAIGTINTVACPATRWTATRR